MDLRDFRLARDGRLLVQGGSWTVEPGERILLTGPSGSGKSSFLLGIAGLAEHSPGLTWEARETARPRVGLLFQNPYSQLVCPTVDQELAFALENAGWPGEAMEARVTQLKRTFGLEGLGDRAPWTFSGGEAQRVALAAVLAPRPDVVLLDEPLGYLDGASADALVALASQTGEAGAWVVVDHDPRPWRGWLNRHGALCDGAWTEGPVPESGPSEEGPERTSGGPLILEVEGLTAGYRGSPAVLKDFSLSVTRGETLALVGPSGSGKSTFFRCLTGQVRPSSGRLLVDGKPYRPRLRRRSPFSWVPQVPEHYFVFPTAREEWGAAAAAARAFGLESLADRHPFTLSEGEKRRLNLAAALAEPRSVLLLDEPQYGLDAASQRELVKAIGVLQDQGKTLVIISHDPSFCRRVAHRTKELAR